jgi:elongation factor P
MDTTTYDQINLTMDFLGDTLEFIEEGQYVEFLIYENKPINIELPSSVTLEVKSSIEAVKGDTATNVTKEATLSTNLKVQVPLFINTGDKIKVDTRTREYIERVNN